MIQEDVYIAQYEAACAEMKAANIRCAPHYLYKPKLSLDGNMWCALLGDNIQEGVCGFGETPEKAMAEFDKAWRGEEQGK
jgi:hypothetical protein